MRISTQALHQQGVAALLDRQAALARTQQQLTTGSKLIRAADDPSGAELAQRLDHAVASLGHLERGANLLTSRLSMQDAALSDSGDYLTRAREIAVQANTATVSAQDRALLAVEVRHIRKEMLNIANRQDGNGRYLFAGTRDGVVPFNEAGGVVSYAGDDGRNRVEVAPDLALQDADPGSDVFMRPRTGDGQVRAAAAAANTGTGVVRSASVTDFTAWAGRSLSLQFTAPGSWQMMDGATVVATGTYQAGDAINAGGVSVQLSGAPAAGDTFAVGPAPRKDVFATLEDLADALEAPAASATERARQAGQLGAALSDIAVAQEHFLGLRASTGARLNTLDAAANRRADDEVSLKSVLSDLRDTNYAEATTQLQLQLTAIEAAQRTMLRVQSLSLFDKM